MIVDVAAAAATVFLVHREMNDDGCEQDDSTASATPAAGSRSPRRDPPVTRPR